MWLRWLIAMALVLWFLTKTQAPKLWHLGRLPGDVLVRCWRFKIHLPFTSTVLLAVVLYAASHLFLFKI